MNVVRCNHCGMIFTETMIDQTKDEDHCPMCGLTGALQDIDSNTTTLSKKELMKLWLLFGDIPINDQDEIEEEFFGFPVGTNRFDIWHWFDERYTDGVHALIYQ